MEVSLPWVEIAGFAIVPVILLAFVFGVRSAQLPESISRVRGWAVFAAVLLWSFSALLWMAHRYEQDGPLLGSPDGRHVARLIIWGEEAEGTSLRVIERRSGRPSWQVVSKASTIGMRVGPIEPRLRWVDDSHLVIDYPTPTQGTSFDCQNKQAAEIQIVCVTHH
jgi:hypothetical protein